MVLVGTRQNGEGSRCVTLAHLHLLNELLLIQGTGQVPLVPQDEDLQGRTGDT